MISNISHMAEAQNKGTQTQTKIFNAALPVAIEVLEKLSPTRYMLKLGNTTLTTKSMTELFVGAKYWAQMSRSTDGTIALSNLIAQPKILAQLSQAPMRLNENTLKELFDDSKGNPWENLKNQLLERAAMADNKADFNFYMQMLLSLHNKVITLPLSIQEREALLQMRKKKRGVKLYEIEFYAVFSMLGAIEGKLVSDNETIDLYLATPYSNSAALLEKNRGFLKGISNFIINIKKDIMPLYEFKESHGSLIDLKG